jgi:hypothetical protein
MADDEASAHEAQIRRAERLRRQIERLKRGQGPDQKPDEKKSLKERIEERAKRRAKSARAD